MTTGRSQFCPSAVEVLVTELKSSGVLVGTFALGGYLAGPKGKFKRYFC